MEQLGQADMDHAQRQVRKNFHLEENRKRN